ncbi:hypothetical protein LVB77_14335 [Lysobacter sp. 5GHs7-4]|uniref:hypothetical protein n=1 Tax=Lysobacter sp. 5GHs7-4 TaxID=2904253 RepID=UPI001E5C8199|nr:hypothetical protein [Lysobacter sp. 5GHs7-4]UHQ21843.1 hypothetical protein LVB77_14335 [Lysobacter sp. 5GHs7-4]
MHYTSAQIEDEVQRLDATLARVSARAGRGLDYELERRLDAHRRSLSDMVGADGVVLVLDTVNAAKHAMGQERPGDYLAAMESSRRTLALVLRRLLSRLEAA